MRKNRDYAKKRLMFIQKEDYNFLTYNLLLLLKTLDCNNEENRFRDFRKIAYLIEFISSNADINSYASNELAIIYSKAQLKKKLISHLLIVLRNKSYLDISINRPQKTFDIWINEENIPTNFFENSLFEKEIENITKLKNYLRPIKITTIKTMVDKLFKNNGVLTWEI